MEKQPDHKHGDLFEDDDLDEAVAVADDTGMVKFEQTIVEEETLEHIPPPEEEQSP